MKKLLAIFTLTILFSCGPSNPIPDKSIKEKQDTVDLSFLKEDDVMFTDLDSALNAPDKTKYLSLSFQKLDSLPSSICRLINLERLELTGCSLKSIPNCIGNLKMLRLLDIRQNQIKVFPLELFNLKNLEKLDYWGNSISSLPEDIGKLENLKELIISFNNINVLPKNISSLKKLTYLQCDGNNLSSISKEIGNMNQLHKLSFMRNNIRYVDKNISNLKNLQEIILDENILSDQQIKELKDLLPQCSIYADLQKQN